VDTDTLISSVIYSVQELDDAFDLEAFLTRIGAGIAVSRAREMALTRSITNDGLSTPLPHSPSGGILGAVTAGFTQSSGTLAAGVTQGQLLQLSSSVDRVYFETGSYMASPSVEAALRAQTDTTGRLLYPIDDATGLLRIGGKLLYPNAAMAPALTASSPLVLFGAFDKFYSVQNAGGVKIKILANEESPNLAFHTREMIIYTRLGATTGVSNAVKALVSAAS
jgi:HK97 family phage major capsid protein